MKSPPTKKESASPRISTKRYSWQACSIGFIFLRQHLPSAGSKGASYLDLRRPGQTSFSRQ